jgi:hypothetical protein
MGKLLIAKKMPTFWGIREMWGEDAFFNGWKEFLALKRFSGGRFEMGA